MILRYYSNNLFSPFDDDFNDLLEKYVKLRITVKKFSTKIFNFRMLEFSSKRRGSDSMIHCYKKYHLENLRLNNKQNLDVTKVKPSLELEQLNGDTCKFLIKQYFSHHNELVECKLVIFRSPCSALFSTIIFL